MCPSPPPPIRASLCACVCASLTVWFCGFCRNYEHVTKSTKLINKLCQEFPLLSPLVTVLISSNPAIPKSVCVSVRVSGYLSFWVFGCSTLNMWYLILCFWWCGSKCWQFYRTQLIFQSKPSRMFFIKTLGNWITNSMKLFRQPKSSANIFEAAAKETGNFQHQT